MKKLVILLVVIVLAFAGFLTWLSYQPETHMALTNEEAPAYDGAMSEEAAAAEVRSLDYEALSAAHANDEVIMSINGEEVLWEDYYAWLYMNAMQVEAFFEQMAMYYGVPGDWEGSVGDDSGMIYAQLPPSAAEETLLRIIAIEKLAADKGVVLSAESEAQLSDEALATAVIGEGATVEELLAALDEMHMSLDTYKRISRANFLYGDILAEICEAEVYEYSKDIDFRKTYTYSASDDVYGELPAPERENLVFAGWYTGPDGTGNRIAADTVIGASSYSLYSKWEPMLSEDITIVSLPGKREYC
ncbi:MAG: InlB B-repeat-containing protein, partial [Oscillospiraceae bacterium]|nr:InlB B-repeat-containing protein [Oscillospiraceae bacterium]